jgi:hypothetical protein
MDDRKCSVGSFGNITSAIVCAASSFSMSVTDPTEFLKEMDLGFFRNYKNAPALTSHSLTAVKYVEPHVGSQAPLNKRFTAPHENEAFEEPSSNLGKIKSKVVVLEDFIDTDAVGLYFHMSDMLD